MNPNAVIDQKLANVAAKFDGGYDPTKPTDPGLTASGHKKPTTIEAFLEMAGMADFPQMNLVTVKNPNVIEIEDVPVGSVEEIKELLREAAPIDLSALEKCAVRLDDLEGRLRHYADQVLCEATRTSRLKDNLFHAPPISDLSEKQRAISQKKQQALDLKEQLAELQKRKVEYCRFPGYRPGELTELPSQLEGPMLLHRVTKAQDFNKRNFTPGFRRFWKKAFLSEASIALMQDIFWWFYIDKFDKTVINVENQDRLYDRIADSFNSLFLSVHPEIKDKFFSVYCDCLSQAIFAAYHEAFPESDETFDNEFKQDLCNLVHEWITGIKPPPGTFMAWDIRRLEPKFKGPAAKNEDDLQQKMIQVAALNKGPKNNLDIEGFQAAVRRMGDGSTSRLGTAPREPSLHKEPAALALLPVSGKGIDPLTASRQAHCGTPRRVVKESHQVGPGPEFSRVLFNIKGRSPLVQHYLYMRKLKELDQIGTKVTRTEISKRPPARETYKHVINQSLEVSEKMKSEYQKVCDYTNHEIAKIERKKVQTYHKIESLKQKVRECRNLHDLTLIADYIQSGEYEKKEGVALVPDKVVQESESSGEEWEEYEDMNQNVK